KGLSEADFMQVALGYAAVKQVNERDGTVLPFLAELPCKVNLNHGIFDTGRHYTVALQQFHTLDALWSEAVDDHKVGIVGCQRSSTTIPVSFVASVPGIPTISYSATSINLDDKSAHPYFLRTIPSDTENTRVIAHFLAEISAVEAIVIYMEDVWG